MIWNIQNQHTFQFIWKYFVLSSPCRPNGRWSFQFRDGHEQHLCIFATTWKKHGKLLSKVMNRNLSPHSDFSHEGFSQCFKFMAAKQPEISLSHTGFPEHYITVPILTFFQNCTSFPSPLTDQHVSPSGSLVGKIYSVPQFLCIVLYLGFSACQR